MSDSSVPRPGVLRAIPAGIWVLGFVSMLMDISSEMIHALLPVYLVSTLGASMLAVGMIEGIAEATASIVKVFSGTLSDWFGKRKGLTAFGYGLAALTKPVFPLATGIGWITAARFIDRIGKGIRGAPRDALVADLAPRELRGASFGLRQSLDTFGAVAGPLLAVALMLVLAGNIRAVFWWAVAPAFLAVALVLIGVKEPERHDSLRDVRNPLSLKELRLLGERYWWVVALGAVFTLARFSEAFLVLRAQSLGFSSTYVPLIMVVMSLTYTLSAYPAGALSDRIGRTPLLMAGLGVLCISDLVLASAGTPLFAVLGAALWGVHMGLTQGLFSALISDAAPAELRGTAFGLFHLVSGGALLLASLLAGALWQAWGPQATFLASGAFALISLIGVASVQRRLSPPAQPC